MRPPKLLLLLALLCAAQITLAQQTYQSSHYGTPGDLYLYNRFNDSIDVIELTKSGADITWDFSAHAALNTHTNSIVEPAEAFNLFNFLTICTISGFSSGQCFDIWNNTDQALLLKDSLTLLDFTLADLQRYQAIDADRLLERFIGFTVDLGGNPTDAVIVYQAPDTILNFPMNYDDAWTSHISFLLDLTPSGQNIVYKSNQSRVTEIDGWGTLMTPYDTFENVLKVTSVITRIDTVTVDFEEIALALTQVEYMWFDTNYRLPIMTANGMILDGDSVVIDAMEYIYNAVCPIPTWEVTLDSDVFYLDENGMVTIDFNISNPNANTYNWDFGDQEQAETDGATSHTFNAVGEYTASVVGCMTNCLPEGSCSFQILDFEILDTLTSIQPVDGYDLGINLYPNPVSDILNVFVPDDLSAMDYTIVDITGRQVASGTLKPGNNRIEINQITNGLYTIITKSPNNRGVFLRFLMGRE